MNWLTPELEFDYDSVAAEYVITRQDHRELTEENAIEILRRWNSYPDLLKACKRDAELANVAIAATPTGKDRNKLTEINILRLAAIAKVGEFEPKEKVRLNKWQSGQ